MPEAYVKMFMGMYHNITTMIRCTSGLSSAFGCTIAAHQGACSSPLLFNTTMNFLVFDLMEALVETLSFADDYAMVEEDVSRLQEVLNQWREKLESNGLRISRQKGEYLFCPFSDSNPDAPTPHSYATLQELQIPRWHRKPEMRL